MMNQAPITRRTVFYIEGYDPRGPAHYHALYRDEAARQEKVNGLALKVGPRRKVDAITSGWSVSSPTTETQYLFLRYDDLMRQRWSRTTPAILRDILRYTWAFTRRGVFAGMYRLSWPILIFSTMAPALLAIVVLVSLLAGIAVAYFANTPLGVVAALALFGGLLLLRPVLESRMTALWLARIGAYTTDRGAGNTPGIESRIDAFAQKIAAEVLAGSADEVLVVGHSAGSHVGVSACARALQLMGSSDRRLSFVTLGQAIPFIALQPCAVFFHDELKRAAADPRLDWIDFSAPRDGLCFALTDPLLSAGLAQPDPDNPKPKLLSARFNRLFTPETYARLQRDYYRLHFQYLMAAEQPGDYDYFLITAGDMTLAQRFAQAPSIKSYDRFRTTRS